MGYLNSDNIFGYDHITIVLEILLASGLGQDKLHSDFRLPALLIAQSDT